MTDEHGERRARDEGPRAYRWLAAVVSVLLTPFVRIETHRMDVSQRYRTGVVVTNHRSLFDVAVGLVAFHRIRRYPRTIVAAEWFERRTTGWALRAAGALPIDRTDPSAYYEAAQEVLDAGIPILVLPEGRLAGDPDDRTSVGDFKTGAARLALTCDVPVFALGIVGADDVWPAGRIVPRLNPFRRRRVVLLGAAEALHLEGDDVRAATEIIRGTVVELLGEAVQLYEAG